MEEKTRITFMQIMKNITFLKAVKMANYIKITVPVPIKLCI